MKWSMNRFIPFICIDPGVTSDEDLRDEEEFILTQDVSLQEFKSLMLRGEMMLPSVQCGIMALDYIERKI